MTSHGLASPIVEAVGAGVTARDDAAARFGRWAADLRTEFLPSDVVERGALSILDTLGCAIYGQTLPIASALRSAHVENDGPVQVWGSSWQTTARIAALVNGTAAHSHELDDLHPSAILHPGSVTLPAVLSTAEGQGSTSSELLVAYIAGIEVASRIGLVTGTRLLLRGWHPTGVLGVFSAAVAAGRIMRLEPSQMANAIRLAASMAAGPMATQFGGDSKRLHAGLAAQSGIRAATLARVGLEGTPLILEAGYGGVGHAFCGIENATPEQFFNGLGDSWEMRQIGFKVFPACTSSHTALEAILALRENEGFGAADIHEIVVHTSTATEKHVGWEYVPQDVTTAQMNLSYVVAAAVLDPRSPSLLSEDGFVDLFSSQLLRAPVVLELTRRVRVVTSESIDRRGREARHEVVVEVMLVDGRQLRATVRSPRGSAARPLTEAEVQRKFRKLAEAVFSDTRVTEIQEYVMTLGQAGTAEGLADLLRVPV